MTFYLIFAVVVILLLSADWLERREGYGALTIVALFVIIAVTVLRYEIGYDYLNYRDIYDWGASRLMESNYEWGFVGLVALLRGLGLGDWWMFAVIGTAIPLLMFRGVRLYTPNVRLAMLIYLLIPGLFINSFSIIRQAISIIFVFNSFFYYHSKQYRQFFGFYTLGVLFHYSALFALPFFLLAPALQKYARTIVLVGIPVSLAMARFDVIGFIFSGLLGATKYIAYADFADAGTSFVKILVLNMTVVLYLFFYRRMDKLNRTLLVVVAFGLMLFNMFSSIGAITRISYYFRIFEIVLLANMVPFFKRSSQPVVCIFITVFFFIMFYSSLSFDYSDVDTYPKMTPYKTIFSQ